MTHPVVNEVRTIKHPIFIFENYDGKSIFHLCKESNNYKLFDNLLAYLKLYPIDHHSRALKPFLSELIDKNLSNFHDYI